jgi:hypothetical protein
MDGSIAIQDREGVYETKEVKIAPKLPQIEEKEQKKPVLRKPGADHPWKSHYKNKKRTVELSAEIV